MNERRVIPNKAYVQKVHPSLVLFLINDPRELRYNSLNGYVPPFISCPWILPFSGLETLRRFNSPFKIRKQNTARFSVAYSLVGTWCYLDVNKARESISCVSFLPPHFFLTGGKIMDASVLPVWSQILIFVGSFEIHAFLFILPT